MLRAYGSSDNSGGGKVRQSGRGGGNGKGSGGGGGGSGSTWDSAKKGANITLSGGDLVATAVLAGSVGGTQGKSASGVWQFEVTIGTVSGSVRHRVGIIQAGTDYSIALGAQNFGAGIGYVAFSGFYQSNGYNAYGASFTTGDVIGVVFDAGTGSLTFYKNGVSQGVALTGLTGTWYPAFGYDTTGDVSGTLNVGTTAFAYPIGGATAWG